MGKQKNKRGNNAARGEGRRVQGLADDIIEGGIVKPTGRNKFRLRDEADDEVSFLISCIIAYVIYADAWS